MQGIICKLPRFTYRSSCTQDAEARMQSGTCGDGCQDEHVILARGQCQVDGVRVMQSVFKLRTGSEAGLGNKRVVPGLHFDETCTR